MLDQEDLKPNFSTVQFLLKRIEEERQRLMRDQPNAPWLSKLSISVRMPNKATGNLYGIIQTLHPVGEFTWHLPIEQVICYLAGVLNTVGQMQKNADP